MATPSRLSFWVAGRRVSIWIPDYFYTGHATILGGIPFNAGWMQGLGFIVIQCEWKREVLAARRRHRRGCGDGG